MRDQVRRKENSVIQADVVAIAKRIRKLHWIGLDEEAHKLQENLCKDGKRYAVLLSTMLNVD